MRNRYLVPDRISTPRVALDAAGRMRSSFPTTLGDYKQVGFDRTLLFSDVATGTGAWSNNKYVMSVAGSQYVIKQSRRVHPYFSGKSQIVEITFDRFEHEENVTKRVGYFSSSTAAPYTATLDGFFLESDGTEYYLRCYRNGTLTVSVPSQAWDNWTDVNKYNFQFFTVIMFDFLWLGGAVLRFWIKTDQGFSLIHTVHYAGSSEDVFILNPSQPLRVEIRGNNGGGQMRFICAQVATEGQIDEAGQGYSINTTSAEINLATADTRYPLIGVRKKAARLEASVALTSMNIGVSSANDRGVWELHLNPTLSAPITWADVTNFSVQKGTGNGIITVTSPGVILDSGPISTNIPIPSDALQHNFFSYLSQQLNGTMDEYILCVTPQTAGIASTGYMDFKEY